MNPSNYILVVLGMGIVSYIPRWFPLFFLTRRTLPKWLVEWLDLIPVAILSALLLPELFTSGIPRQFDGLRPEMLVALPTLLIAFLTKSLGGTLISGMFFYWLASRLL